MFDNWRYEQKAARQRKKRGYADEDCWGLHYWLSSTFPAMIITLRDMKHGAPDLKFEEYDKLPSGWKTIELQKYKEKTEKEGYQFEEDFFTKWYIILTRIAYCLEQCNDEATPIQNPYADQFFKMSIDKGQKIDRVLADKYLSSENYIFEYRDSMKNEALDLIKKYFWHLWD